MFRMCLSDIYIERTALSFKSLFEKHYIFRVTPGILSMLIYRSEAELRDSQERYITFNIGSLNKKRKIFY